MFNSFQLDHLTSMNQCTDKQTDMQADKLSITSSYLLWHLLSAFVTLVFTHYTLMFFIVTIVYTSSEISCLLVWQLVNTYVTKRMFTSFQLDCNWPTYGPTIWRTVGQTNRHSVASFLLHIVSLFFSYNATWFILFIKLSRTEHSEQARRWNTYPDPKNETSETFLGRKRDGWTT